MNEKLKKYIKREEYNSDNDETEIWIGEFSNDPIDPINVISEIISNFNSKSYKIIIDDYLSYNSGGIWNSPIIFNNITFNKGIEFKYYSFDNNVSFINCIFVEAVIFGKSILKKDVSFVNCIFKSNTNFWGTTFSSKSVFSESRFEGLDNNFWQSHFYGDVFCENINVRSNINFSDTIFEENVYFKEAILKGEINFSNVKFKNDQKDNIEEKKKKEIDFSRVLFGVVTFNNTDFQKNVRFHDTQFHNIANFKDTNFERLVDFYNAHFYNAQQFHFTDFLDRAIFSNTEFDQEVQFLYCRVTKDSYVRFESAIFKKGLDISRSNFNDRVNFWNIQIEEGDIFKTSEYINDFEPNKKNVPSVYKQLRETYRIIKDNLYKQNNKIEGLHFSEKEMSVYLEEKRAEDSKTKQEKEKNDLLIQESKASVSINSSKKSFKNIKKKYVRIYEDLSFVKVLFLIIFLVLEFLFSPILLFLCIFQTIYLRFKYVLQKIRNVIVIPIKKLYFYIRIFIRICFYRLLSLKNKSDFLFMFAFLVITLASGIVYIIVHKYIWYWITLFLFALWVYLEFYHNRRNIKYTIRSNNYISLVLLCIPMMLIFIMLYGVNDYENDLIYKILSFIFSQFSMMFKDNEIFKFFLITILIFIAIIFSIISKKQDKLLLWFNKNSNIFDTDWVVGVNFTILVTLIAYIVILSLNPNLFFLPNSEGVGNFLRGLVDVLNITDWRYIKILGKTPTNWQYVFLFIGRIFVAYGIYQTVQAFRKFGKS